MAIHTYKMPKNRCPQTCAHCYISRSFCALPLLIRVRYTRSACSTESVHLFPGLEALSISKLHSLDPPRLLLFDLVYTKPELLSDKPGAVRQIFTVSDKTTCATFLYMPVRLTGSGVYGRLDLQSRCFSPHLVLLPVLLHGFQATGRNALSLQPCRLTLSGLQPSGQFFARQFFWQQYCIKISVYQQVAFNFFM